MGQGRALLHTALALLAAISAATLYSTQLAPSFGLVHLCIALCRCLAGPICWPCPPACLRLMKQCQLRCAAVCVLLQAGGRPAPLLAVARCTDAGHGRAAGDADGRAASTARHRRAAASRGSLVAMTRYGLTKLGGLGVMALLFCQRSHRGHERLFHIVSWPFAFVPPAPIDLRF